MHLPSTRLHEHFLNYSMHALRTNLLDEKTCILQLNYNLKLFKIFTTYKCVVFGGSFDAILSKLSPTEVHCTDTRCFSIRHVQFPTSEHRVAGFMPLLELWSPRSLPLPLPRAHSFSGAAKIRTIQKAKISISMNIIF